MISNMSIVGCGLSLAVSTLLPIAFIIYYGSHHKGEGIMSAWLLGALGFVIPQMVVRIPLLNLVGSIDGFQAFATSHVVLYALALGLTAGLFEFAGRFVVAKYVQKKGRLNYPVSLAAGLGHGGVEAIILLGMTYINYMSIMLMIRSGNFDTLMAEASGMEMGELQQIKELMVNTHPVTFFLGGFERLLAMTAHVGMSMVVCYAVDQARTGLGFLICVGYHAVIDTVCGLSSMLATPQFGSRISETTVSLIVYPILTVCAALAMYVTFRIRRQWYTEGEEE